MIIAGALRNDKLVLTTRSAAEASLVKNGIAGENPFLPAAPYGNRVDFSVDANTITLTKHSGQAFTYEEVRSFIKKIILFGRITESEAKSLLDLARAGLGSRLTFFYPNNRTPKIEVSFAYNWVAVEFDNTNFNEIFEKASSLITQNQKSSVKVFSSNLKTITIHDYSMDAIYVRRNSFEGIADAIISDGVILPGEKYIFITRASASNIKSVIYMEARRLTKGADENFEFSDNKALDPLIGRKELLVPLINIMDEITKRGGFSGLKPEQIKLLKSLSANMQEVDKYSPSKSIRESIRFFLQDFSEEVNSLSAS